MSFSDVRIIKVLDKSTLILFVDEARAKIIRTGTLEPARPDGQVFMDYKLSNVIVTGVQDLGSGRDGTTDEQVTLRFSKIEWDYTPYDATGQAGSTVTTSWDRTTNQSPLPGTVSGTPSGTSPATSPSTSTGTSPSTSTALVSASTGGTASKNAQV